jgi:hypothetical protein
MFLRITNKAYVMCSVHKYVSAKQLRFVFTDNTLQVVYGSTYDTLRFTGLSNSQKSLE